MAPPVERLPLKRRAISDQQRRRDIALLRQAQARRDAQNQARCLASAILSDPTADIEREPLEPECEPAGHAEAKALAESGDAEDASSEMDVLQASKLRGPKARRWFSRQLMLPEWMIDVPPRLSVDWYVFPRPAGKRCFVVSSNGTTISRLRNGTVLHRFPSALPNGARTKEVLGPASLFSILDCVFHEHDQTYYVIDMICWRGYSLYDCTAEFRFFWLNSKLAETGACNPPSFYHKYRFSVVPVYDCDQAGILAAYTGHLPFIRDGLLFYNRVVGYFYAKFSSFGC
ncbi:Snurportin-1 [Nymphaea thermarum]|nr:Snurportin-1 [Nymphaea thermarum]